MSITVLPNGGIAIDGKDSVALFRLMSIRSALSLKIKTGMEPARGVRIVALVKKEFNLQGKPQALLEQLDVIVEKAKLAHAAEQHAQPAAAQLSGTQSSG